MQYQTANSAMVGMIGFEPMIFCSQSRRGNQAALHPENGAPDKIRTRDPQIRSLILYPAELLAHTHYSARNSS